MSLSETLESIRGFSFFEKKTKTSNPLYLEYLMAVTRQRTRKSLKKNGKI
jgi:hypothetical protein